MNTTDILTFLGIRPGPPTLRTLNRLIDAYVRRVPWESVFRIAKHRATPEPHDCPRWPDEFWRDAMMLGGGGSCFETNYAFFQLLKSLGYDGYLTINDMGEQRGVHTAIVLRLAGHKYLVDVGMPVLAAVRLSPGKVTQRQTWLHRYTIAPEGSKRYSITRTHHPRRYMFTLIDRPVAEDAYRAALEADYGEGGLFLDTAIVVKVIGDRLWRFNSGEVPYRLVSFGVDGARETPIAEGDAARAIAERFGMDEAKVAAALAAVEKGSA